MGNRRSPLGGIRAYKIVTHRLFDPLSKQFALLAAAPFYGHAATGDRGSDANAVVRNRDELGMHASDILFAGRLKEIRGGRRL